MEHFYISIQNTSYEYIIFQKIKLCFFLIWYLSAMKVYNAYIKVVICVGQIGFALLLIWLGACLRMFFKISKSINFTMSGFLLYS